MGITHNARIRSFLTQNSKRGLVIPEHFSKRQSSSSAPIQPVTQSCRTDFVHVRNFSFGTAMIWWPSLESSNLQTLHFLSPLTLCMRELACRCKLACLSIKQMSVSTNYYRSYKINTGDRIQGIAGETKYLDRFIASLERITTMRSYVEWELQWVHSAQDEQYVTKAIVELSLFLSVIWCSPYIELNGWQLVHMERCIISSSHLHMWSSCC